MAHHKTFREMDNYSVEQQKKLAPFVKEFSQLTLEEAIYVMQQVNRMIWLSLQTVEEKSQILNGVENEQESL